MIKNKFKSYKLNVLPSIFDERDYNVEKLIKNDGISLPEIFDLREKMLGVKDQGEQGSCSAMTASQIKEWQENVDVNLNEYLSAQFIYNNRENQTSEGMTPRDTMKILANIGIVEEKLYPYGKLERKSSIGLKLYDAAKRFKIEGYGIVTTIEGLKQALYNNGPCYIAVPVYNYSTRLWKQNSSEELLGGHAMTIVGWTKEGFIIRNSWGLEWGDKGHCIFPYSDWGLQWEIWSTIDQISYYIPKKECKLFRLFKKIFGK